MASKKPVDHPSVRHPSHNHPLVSVIKAKDENDEMICSGCELDLTGQAFKCTEKDCDYFIHKSCFDLPLEINHNSHPEHPLTLLHSSPYGESYECSACGESGSGFIYDCSECQYGLHVGCVVHPETVEREDHEHPLTLLYKIPYEVEEGLRYVCSICEEDFSETLWLYHCKECDYATHVHASFCESSQLNSLIRTNCMLMGMQLQTKRVANRNALASLRG